MAPEMERVTVWPFADLFLCLGHGESNLMLDPEPIYSFPDGFYHPERVTSDFIIVIIIMNFWIETWLLSFNLFAVIFLVDMLSRLSQLEPFQVGCASSGYRPGVRCDRTL